LYYRLNKEQRDTVFGWLYDEGRSLKDVAAQIEANIGIATSEAALSGMCKRHAFAWKVDCAKAAANDKATSLPTDYDAKKKAALAQREFEKVFNELTTQEVIALQRLDLDRQIAKTNGEIELEKLKLSRIKAEQGSQRLALDKEKWEVECCENFLKWFSEARAREIAAAPISNAEKIAQLRATYFADVNELEKSGKVVLPE
jgi:hypothetical protein